MRTKCRFVMPARIAGIHLGSHGWSGDIHVSLDSSTPCWNDTIEGSAFTHSSLKKRLELRTRASSASENFRVRRWNDNAAAAVRSAKASALVPTLSRARSAPGLPQHPVVDVRSPASGGLEVIDLKPDARGLHLGDGAVGASEPEVGAEILSVVTILSTRSHGGPSDGRCPGHSR